jgi:hypothetical protein
MKKGNKLFISCEQAIQYCNKSQYKEITFYDKLILKIHIFICKLCKAYTTKNTKLTQLLKDEKVQCMHPEHKMKMDSLLRQEILENHQN